MLFNYKIKNVSLNILLALYLINLYTKYVWYYNDISYIFFVHRKSTEGIIFSESGSDANLKWYEMRGIYLIE